MCNAVGGLLRNLPAPPKEVLPTPGAALRFRVLAPAAEELTLTLKVQAARGPKNDAFDEKTKCIWKT